MQLTPAQQAAVEHRGSNLLLAASAGAGKTEVLARRCLSLIADPRQPCGVDQLLVVTFTRAAAAELRVRVARMLREEAGRASGALRRHLQRQERLVDAADIGTIDAWCARIVREHYAHTGLDVGFRVLGEQEAPVLRAEVLGEFFEYLHRSTEPLARAARDWLSRATSPDDQFLRRLIQSLNLYREHVLNPAAWLDEQRLAAARDDAPQVLAKALLVECRFQLAELARLVESQRDGALAAACVPYRQALLEWSDALEAAGRTNDAAAVGEVVREVAEFSKKWRTRKSEPALAKQIRDRWLKRRLQDAYKPANVHVALAQQREVGNLVTTLLDLEQAYEARLQSVKRTQAAFEFSDVLRITLDLLGTPEGEDRRRPTEIARRLQQRYEHVLVDEYQDTSPVQVAILRLVTRPGPGNSFLVGDVKQSIYGFRQAEPRLFAQLLEAWGGRDLQAAGGSQAGQVQNLTDNFRSHAGLLAPLNAIFERLFDPQLGGTRYGRDERLVAARAAAEPPNSSLDGAPRLAVHVIEAERGHHAATNGDQEEELEGIEREAQLAAEDIHRLLARGVQIPERATHDRIMLRPLRLSDIVILLRAAKENAAQVTRVLRRNGLACVTQGPESLLSAVEARDLITVLRLLVNRRQDVGLAAYLRGPMVGLNPGELLTIRSACPAGDFLDAVEHFREARETDSLAARVDAAMARLDVWQRRSGEEDLPALLRRIVQETGLEFFAAGLHDGAQRVALLRTVRDLASSFGTGGGVAEFLAFWDSLAQAALEPPAQTAGHENAIRVMTIHAAKGLEYPVVYLLGAGGSFNRESLNRELQCDPQDGLGLKFADYTCRTELRSARHLVVRQRVAARELEEELRLLYVAATRARERLVVIGTCKAGEVEQWHEQFGGSQQLPLITRQAVTSRLEWLLWAIFAMAGTPDAARVAVTKYRAEEINLPALDAETDAEAEEPSPIAADAPYQARAPASGPANEPAVQAASPTWTADDEAWIKRSRHLLAANIGSPWDRFPALLSVSAAKAAVFAQSDEAESARPVHHTIDLPGPAFVRDPDRDDGRTVGTACHRFLQFADVARLRSERQVREQAGELVAGGRLSAQESALLPAGDLAWFGTTAEGRLLADAGAAARREMPFVYALPVAAAEHALLRGVIDVVIDTPAGLVLLDYKTDVVSGEEEMAERTRAYTVQAQLYTRAAAGILGRPVARFALVFLRMRRVLDVDLRSDVVESVLRSL